MIRTEAVRRSRRKQEIKQLYLAAFPKEDRMPFWMMVAMSYLRSTEFLAFYDKDDLCGFVYMATINRQTFVMFLAVPEALRSKGYGSQILAQVQSLHPNNKIVISIEPCDADAKDIDLRVRRKQFYLANGYAETGCLIRLGGKTQEIIIKNGVFHIREFRLFLCGTATLQSSPGYGA